MRKKVTVVGAGNVGASLVQRIGETELADVVMAERSMRGSRVSTGSRDGARAARRRERDL